LEPPQPAAALPRQGYGRPSDRRPHPPPSAAAVTGSVLLAGGAGRADRRHPRGRRRL